MKEPQARAIIEQVQRDYPSIIQASLERNPKAKSGAVCVGLLLTTAHRRLSLRYPGQYQKALEAWQCFLLPEDERQRLIQQQPIAAETDEDEGDELESKAS